MTRTTSNFDSERRAIDQLVARLARRYPELPLDEVRTITQDEYERFAGCRIRAFIPILVERVCIPRLIERQRPHIPPHA